MIFMEFVAQKKLDLSWVKLENSVIAFSEVTKS
jgi:hypothetical protein